MNYDKACLYIVDEVQGVNDYPFQGGAEGIGMKNFLYSFVYLRDELARRGVRLATRDINLPEDSFLLFSWDNPHRVTAEKRPGQTWCLLVNDPPSWAPESWDEKYHDNFDYVFTYDETKVDNKKYFYYPWAFDTEFFTIPDLPSEEDFHSRRLATFVSHAIHKFPDPNNPHSSLHWRYRTIEWYGRNHPEDFRFYGGTFIPRHYYFGFRGVSFLRLVLPEKLFHGIAKYAQKELIRVYGGTLTPLGKYEVIKQFRFYYCYENTVGINGYICEKIFDCFYSGIVPIYWGASNVDELIPYKCFIDGNEFSSERELYEFISSMSYETWSSYLEQAAVFLRSKEMERFTVKNSVECILEPLETVIESRHGNN
jgi:hypothetical protein